jgi:mono/diheme cytochrome c family protein
MLRESRARWLAISTVLVVVALAALFASLRNPGPQGPREHAVSTPAPADDERLRAGRAAFQRLGCARCHALGGVGNPGAPLDGVGGRLDAAALRDWTLGTGAAAGQLPAGIVRAKARAAQDPELEQVIEVLVQSRTP